MDVQYLRYLYSLFFLFITKTAIVQDTCAGSYLFAMAGTVYGENAVGVYKGKTRVRRTEKNGHIKKAGEGGPGSSAINGTVRKETGKERRGHTADMARESHNSPFVLLCAD